MTKQRVAYYYQENIGHHYYGPGHPMKPIRMKLTHHLIMGYGLYRKMECYRPHVATPEELAVFHSDDYVDFLRRVTPETVKIYESQVQKFNCGELTDCPIFDNLFGFCQTYAGGSIDGAVRLNHGHADVAINWAGGLHHAKKCEASGFCYINDIVLAILELLKHHARVLYIDIDIHHGDGVEEAFYTTDRVMCVSFHKFGDFFPGTGAIRDVGAKGGKYYSLNFPLNDGIDDASYESIFKPVIAKVMEVYRPGAVVLQCGADSLTGDRLGCFNLTLKGHAECVRFVRSFGLPTILVGGGGYTVRNVARCWANETATALGEVLPDYIPPNDYVEYYKPDYRLHIDPAPMENLNSRQYLEKCRSILLENLRYIEHAPGVAFQDVPPDWAVRTVEEEIKEAGGSLDPDVRPGSRHSNSGSSCGRIVFDGRREHEAEFYDGEGDIDASNDEDVRDEAMKPETDSKAQKTAMDVDANVLEIKAEEKMTENRKGDSPVPLKESYVEMTQKAPRKVDDSMSPSSHMIEKISLSEQDAGDKIGHKSPSVKSEAEDALTKADETDISSEAVKSSSVASISLKAAMDAPLPFRDPDAMEEEEELQKQEADKYSAALSDNQTSQEDGSESAGIDASASALNVEK